MKTLADIKKIAVLGAGTMGPGIAQTFAMGGYQVTMWTRSESTRDKAIASLQAQLNTFEEEGLLTEAKDAIMARINFASTVEEAVAGADFIQETIVEKKDSWEQWGPFSDIQIMNEWSGKTGVFTPDLADADYVAALKSSMQTRVKAVEDFATKKEGYDKLPDEALDAL